MSPSQRMESLTIQLNNEVKPATPAMDFPVQVPQEGLTRAPSVRVQPEKRFARNPSKLVVL
jgi:hypothetical protein